ncbi:DNA polymerase alpha subunit A [Pancytospora philotis]|nr:DNA polymerase alpha subunit A [Pancytospora philotis]
MRLQIYSIERASDSEVFIHGRYVQEAGSGPAPGEQMAKVKVTGIVSPVYLLPSPGCRDRLVADLQAFTKEILQIEDVVRHNIFYRNFDQTLEMLRLSLRSKVSFAGFESDYCEMLVTEFSSPIKDLVIRCGLRGACLVDIAVPGVTIDCTGRLVLPPGQRVLSVGCQDVKYAGPGSLRNLSTVAIALESMNGNIVGFSCYDRQAVQRGTLRHLQTSAAAATSRAGESARVFDTATELTSHLNGIIAGHEVVVYHNFHNKHKLALKDKIVCDIFDFACGNMKGKDFSIAELAAAYELETAGEEAVTIMELFDRMHALDLGAELSEISGCPLNKCLENAQLERTEFLLLHELYALKHLFPPETPKQMEKYTGGLVLDPVQGFYEDIIILLDFNSLYPSIIREYNVCFSTVGFDEETDAAQTGAPEDGCVAPDCGAVKENGEENDMASKKACIAPSPSLLFLPRILRKLVDHRKEVKEMIKQATCPNERLVLDIRQKAIKLCGNSIYGCLGSPASRFCNYQMASYITAKGRELLSTAKHDAEALGLRVVYGDTDSIMVHTRFPGSNEHLAEALRTAGVLAERINSRFSHIEIEAEKAFKKLLLLTKKKYAALVFKGQDSYIESKGLDMLRRDFCKVSTDLSKRVLDIILEDQEKCQGGRTKPERIYEACQSVATSLHSLPASDFSIYSSFSKDPMLYTSAHGLPHVNLALRLKKEKGVVYKQDDVIQFVIGEGSGPISGRAFHPNENFKIDYTYYIKSQILPPLIRLLSAWPGVSTKKIELVFGLTSEATSAPIERRGITFIMPCCQAVQTPASVCVSCSQPVRDDFYIERVSRMLAEQCLALYHTPALCCACNINYTNHLLQCLQCGAALAFKPKNLQFDQFVTNLEASFRQLNIQPIDQMLRSYSKLSAYRCVDFRKYFSEEIAQYNREAPRSRKSLM